MDTIRFETLEWMSKQPDIIADFSERDAYWFGIFSGSSFSEECAVLTEYNMIPRKMFACDSWEGLPAETPGVPLAGHGCWFQGNFNSSQLFGTTDKELIKQRVLDQVANKTLPIQFVDGYFEVSLTDELAKQCKPASFVNIDVDLYVSTKQIYAWMLKHNLIIKNTIIYYDDWSGTLEGGECKAHAELVAETGMEFELICSSKDTRSYRKL